MTKLVLTGTIAAPRTTTEGGGLVGRGDDVPAILNSDFAIPPEIVEHLNDPRFLRALNEGIQKEMNGRVIKTANRGSWLNGRQID